MSEPKDLQMPPDHLIQGLEEQVKIELANLIDDLRRHGLGYSSRDIIRRALEALPDE